ncbi:MAG: VOC family protein [Promethearchaeota archaeon]
MKIELHHVHLFASDIEKSLKFYQDMFKAEILLDTIAAGARNVLIKIGNSKINFYDQPPKDKGRGAFHHIGIETDDLETLVEHMKTNGFEFKKPITNSGSFKYVMVEGPDHILIELFERVKKKPEEIFNKRNKKYNL